MELVYLPKYKNQFLAIAWECEYTLKQNGFETLEDVMPSNNYVIACGAVFVTAILADASAASFGWVLTIFAIIVVVACIVLPIGAFSLYSVSKMGEAEDMEQQRDSG